MKEESYTQNMIMCNGSVKKKEKKKEFAKWPPMKPPRNISNSLKCFVHNLKSQVDQNFIKDLMKFSFLFFLTNLSMGKKVRSKCIKT